MYDRKIIYQVASDAQRIYSTVQNKQERIDFLNKINSKPRRKKK